MGIVKLNKLILLGITLPLLWGCAAHPTISPQPLAPGESLSGIAFSVENVCPVFVYRQGITPKSDLGLRIGIPFYGSGIDYSYWVYQRGNFSDILNFGFSLSPNSNFDMTYYSLRVSPRKEGRSFYSGFRVMYIPQGINGHQSFRAGFLGGIYFSENFGLEAGYFHDFDKGQPIENLLAKKPADDLPYPVITEFGFPTENSRLVGLSVKVFLNSKIFTKKAWKP